MSSEQSAFGKHKNIFQIKCLKANGITLIFTFTGNYRNFGQN